MGTTLQSKMAIMMALPIRLKMQKRIGKPTPILLITTDQEWEVLYLQIQNKREMYVDFFGTIAEGFHFLKLHSITSLFILCYAVRQLLPFGNSV